MRMMGRMANTYDEIMAVARQALAGAPEDVQRAALEALDFYEVAQKHIPGVKNAYGPVIEGPAASWRHGFLAGFVQAMAAHAAGTAPANARPAVRSVLEIVNGLADSDPDLHGVISAGTHRVTADDAAALVAAGLEVYAGGAGWYGWRRAGDIIGPHESQLDAQNAILSY